MAGFKRVILEEFAPNETFPEILMPIKIHETSVFIKVITKLNLQFFVSNVHCIQDFIEIVDL